jgi:hypothetical protein
VQKVQTYNNPSGVIIYLCLSIVAVRRGAGGNNHGEFLCLLVTLLSVPGQEDENQHFFNTILVKWQTFCNSKKDECFLYAEKRKVIRGSGLALDHFLVQVWLIQL